MPSNSTPSDILVIGGGPTGLFAAFYAGLRQMTVKIVDSLEILGGQLATLYPEKYIYDVPGFPKVLAKDLTRNLVEQATQYYPTVCLGEQVKKLHQREGEGGRPIFTVETSHNQHEARSILIAAGLGAFIPKTLPLANAAAYESRGLHYFVKALDPFRNQRILIVGGGDSAVDWANTLAGLTSSQTLIHRRDGFRAHEDSVAKMRLGPTKILTFHELKAIGGKERIEWAVIYDNRTKHEQTIPTDAVLVNIGFLSSLGPIAEWGLDLEGSAIKVDSFMATSRPGIYAAGDVAAYPGKLKLIATGFGEACIAVNFAKTFIDPSARAFPGHSSEMKR